MILAKKAKCKYGGNVQLINIDNAPKSLAGEFINRINALHNLVPEACHESAGNEPRWRRFLGYTPNDKKNAVFVQIWTRLPFQLLPGFSVLAPVSQSCLLR